MSTFFQNLNLEYLLFVIPAVIIALSFHEAAHAFVAYRFGDPTAKAAGRLTLNPLKHLDIFGTLALIFIHFGWAKPVPINPSYFQGNYRAKMIAVSVAGVSMNFILCLVAALFLMLINKGFLPYYEGVILFLTQLLYINAILIAFNILPIPPLDGSKVLGELLPPKYGNKLNEIGRYGFIILIFLALSGLLWKIISPLFQGIVTFCLTLFGLV
ncbi:MAG: site-2 protease family protein [Bacillota bacterium]|jgi:Zn-dependent protease